MNKIGSIKLDGLTITIYHDRKAKYNPYRLYIEGYKWNEYNQPAKFKKLIAKYGNLASCTAHIHNYINGLNI